ncbi:MAG: peptidoglycan recognition family protein [Campylobacterota bacterium]|nr:peptidoglycan recognition family protein [Campylobacterota bacterium]
MLKLFLLPIIAIACLNGVEITDKLIPFAEKRTALTKTYIEEHYGLYPENISITPRIILIHYTAIDNLDDSYARFISETLPTDRPDIANASALNVSAHFMVDRDGTVYRLMDETTMARHVIGLNYSSIGIENVGGEGLVDNLTPEQLQANIDLISYLAKKHTTLTYLVGHHEYRCFEDHPLWLEKDDNYRTLKHDPGARFMDQLRTQFPKLKAAPCK